MQNNSFLTKKKKILTLYRKEESRTTNPIICIFPFFDLRYVVFYVIRLKHYRGSIHKTET